MPKVIRYMPKVIRYTASLALLLLAGAARADDFYYVAVFAGQTIPAKPDYSHTFAAFVKASGEGSCPTSFNVEDSFCISWLPANLKVRTNALLPECGHNFRLHETIDYVLRNDERVSVWGPYQIDKKLYDNARRQIGLLESGEVRYKAVDTGYRTDHVSNCIHAVADCAEGYRLRILSPGFGQTASWVVTQRFRPFIVNTDETHEWVYSYLGLQDYPIIRRDFDRNPRSGYFWSRLKLLTGTEK
jgi:hypothetical protein